MIKKWFVCAWFAVSVAGCKQGIGDHCQVNSDCTSGACSMSLPQVCVAEETISDGGGFDTKLPPDAIRPDSAASDAPRDTPSDAPRDAAIDAIDSGP